ncbi:uroporphyrinogen-III synthase [Brucella pseudogrignonensis]|uniref:Uroporphyrinogen-III synthase n=1 Tax=Brucella pseudogrignonensis TaxID=419475 RepID=A0ABU1MAR8_9HYPH|nr:uroporphyrinogen-III synthase [Brucella pseudogrignonensis]MDR6432920.1 uroporphyrinogen-III synthase [Brucella pseudogrignonensis]
MAAEHKTGTRGPVLITRPEPSASVTAAKLAALGFLPVLLPLSRTFALEFSVGNQPFDTLAVTSANAFRYASVEFLKPYKALPLFAVGEGTARAARDMGFEKVIEGGGDAVRLASCMAGHLPEGAKVLYLAGRIRQPIFEERVLQAGLKMQVCDVYDVERIDYSDDEIRALLPKSPFVAVLLYSGVAAQYLARMMPQIEAAFGPDTRFLCISGRVAEQLPETWKAQALTADHPDEQGIFRLFSKL